MLKFITKIIPEKGNIERLTEYLNLGGGEGLKKALQNEPKSTIDEIKKSGLQGRGGAGFPTGLKWESFADASGDCKYIICNADEGEPGTFKDRYLLERNCWNILEGMIIAAYATRCKKGFIYLRGEYSCLKTQLDKAITELHNNKLLGTGIMGKEFSFDIEVCLGGGAYICGEESALLESLEGKRGVTRNKPPLPVFSGYLNSPTLINNVETFANIPLILEYGSDYFRTMGTEKCPGTKLICISGCVNNKGVFEVPFGIEMDAILKMCAEGVTEGKKLRFIQIGGISGKCFLPNRVKFRYEINELKKHGGSIGTGAIYFASEDVNILEYMKAVVDFYKTESCGRCTPCREGNYQLGIELAKCNEKGEGQYKALTRIVRILDTMKLCSACGLGQAEPTALNSLLDLYMIEREAM